MRINVLGRCLVPSVPYALKRPSRYQIHADKAALSPHCATTLFGSCAQKKEYRAREREREKNIEKPFSYLFSDFINLRHSSDERTVS